MSDNRERSREQATTWLMRLHEGPITLEDELELQLWLEADPANRTALRNLARVWQMAGEAAELPGLVAARADALGALSRADGQGARKQWLAPRPLWAALAACLLLVVTVAFHFYPDGESYRTGVGERRVVTLADGSRLSLDAATRVDVRYDGERRGLRLLAGRARFEVAKDPRRPFTVTAGDRMVVATGTAFSVELLQTEMRVVLYQGSVAVLEDGPADRAPRHVMLQGKGGTPAERLLAPNTTLIVPAHPSALGHLEPVDAPASTSWERGQLVFSDEPLGIAVERVNRYSPVKLAIQDPVTAALPVSGTFNAGDTDAFVEGVAALYGLRKLQRGDILVLQATAR